jgi:hypothetical protein
VCASERAAIRTAYDVIQTLDADGLGPALFAHFTGEFAPGSFSAKPTREKGGARLPESETPLPVEAGGMNECALS